MRALTKKNLLILGTILLTFGVVQALISIGIIDSFYEITIATICINIILAVSLNLVTGFTGQFSLGHAGFMSIGAYVCAIITLQMNSTLGFLIGTIAGALAAAFVGILIGIPTLRLKGDYLAIATLGLAEIIRVVFLNMEITNGAAGLNGIPRFTNWLWLCFFTVATIVLINNFIKSSHGRACISIREDEIAAESMGINTTKYKVMAFAIGAFFAGIAGALYSSYFYFLKPDLFGFLKSIDILVIV
ncbi:MAG TPA: branched-chain amino acid ABC transporter permease, partial [Anaerovoracaceae bacterium]|nr:branched-chain amino acid ABC transporter permease [Anaerovoracaceae bacterium]